MTKRKIILVLAVCLSPTVFTVQTLSQTPSSNRTAWPFFAERLRNMTEEEKKKELEKMREQRKLYLERLRNMSPEERKREFAKRREQGKLEAEQKRKELKKRSAESSRQWELGREQRRLDREQKRKENQERWAEIRKGLLYEKLALGATEEQWKVIKAKLEKVRHLREQTRSTVGMFLTSSSSSGTKAADSRSRNAPSWQWDKSWKDKAPGELTEAQRLAKELIALVERKNTTPEAFRRKMAALRKARSKEAELKRQLAEARRELCEMLTTRQEAVLVLMPWL